MLSRISRLPWRAIPSWVTGNRLKILMYHSIAVNPVDIHSISPQKFLNQIQTLIQIGYHFLKLPEAIDLLGKKKDLNKYIVLTFDDGYMDFIQYAFPILHSNHIPATLFVSPKHIGKKACWDLYDKNKPIMGWNELETVQNMNVTIASHTFSHLRLTELSDIDLRDELVNSKNILKDRLNNFYPAIAYPGGYYDQRVITTTKNSGYICGLGAASRWGNGPETDFFSLRREKLP